MAGGIEAARPPAVREVRDLVGFLRGCRAEHGLADEPFDIVIGGMSPTGPAAGRDLVGALERAESILRRIEQGPPRI
jgi:hypothetical protein